MMLKIFNVVSIILMILGVLFISVGVFAFIKGDDEALARQWLFYVGGLGFVILLIGSVFKLLLKIEKNTRK